MEPSKELEEFRSRRVVVVGDLMLDEFVRGDVTRISPEAPVPVLEVKERTSMPGGAANAAANVASLGARTALVGCVGSDAAGETMRRLVIGLGIDASGFVVDATRPTTVKTRIVARHQQVVRIDHETRGEFGRDVGTSLIESLQAALVEADACIVSDYGKGLVTPELASAVVKAAAGKPIIVDPKRRDFSAYKGATVITPNLGELEVATGRTLNTLDEIVEGAGSLLPQLEGASVLVTRGPGGMSLIESGRAPVHVPTRARAVFDVTGAGDTVVSTLALALAVGLPMTSAMEVASAAAAIVVSKPGTATVTIDELRAELRAGKPS